jgi:hypothetical protein
MKRTKRFIASVLGVALLGMIAASPAVASEEHKPKPKCAFVSVGGDLKLNASGLLKDYSKAEAKTELIVKLDGIVIGGYPTTFKSNTYTRRFSAPGHYVAKFKAKEDAVKVSCVGTIGPRDITAPVLTMPANITVELTGPGGAVVTFTPTATDAGGPVTLSCTPPSGSTFPLGSTTVNCTATDAAGNTSSGTLVVTVVDTTPPVLTVPADFTVDATGPSGAVVFYTASATDASGPVGVICSPPSGGTFASGNTTVNCSATDASGNTSSGSFVVTVTPDTTPPVLTLPADIAVAATGPGGAVVAYFASAIDAVDGPVAVTCSSPSGSTFATGTWLVTCSATDASGNTGFGSFVVVVTPIPPRAGD